MAEKKTRPIETLSPLKAGDIMELSAFIMQATLEDEVKMLENTIRHRTIYHYIACVIISMLETAAAFDYTAEQMWEQFGDDSDMARNNENN